MFWKKLWAGVKIALFIVNKADEQHLIHIKELPKINGGIDIITDAIKDAQTPKP